MPQLSGDARARSVSGARASHRSAAPGVFTAPEHGAGRHGGHCRHARTPALPEGSRIRGVGIRPAAFVVVLVQSRVSAVRTGRLADAGGHSRKAHRLRSSARDNGMGRSTAPSGVGSPLLRVLSPGPAGRAPDIRRGGPYPRPRQPDPRSDRRARKDGRKGRHCNILLDQQLPKRIGRDQFRELPDQAGGRRDPGRTSRDQAVRDPLADTGISALAGRDAGRRTAGDPGGRGRGGAGQGRLAA